VARTLLQLVSDVAQEVGITAPNAVTSSSDTQVLQLGALYNRLGQDLIQEYEWRRAVLIETFASVDPVTTTGDVTADSAVVANIPSTAGLSAGMQVYGVGVSQFSLIESVDSGTQVTLDMVASVSGTGVSLTFSTQDYALPTDFDRMVPQTNWNRSQHWMNLGAKSAQEWEWLNGGAISTAPRFRYRTFGNKLRLFPAPSDVLNFAYEYVSQYWVVPSAGTNPTKARTTADTDFCIFNDSLMTWGLKFYWLRANKLDFATEEAVFLDLLSKAKSGDEDNPTLSMSPQMGNFLITSESIPEGSWDLS
jgi:hypothetical protein